MEIITNIVDPNILVLYVQMWVRIRYVWCMSMFTCVCVWVHVCKLFVFTPCPLWQKQDKLKLLGLNSYGGDYEE